MLLSELFLDSLTDGASPLAIIVGEFELVLKKVYEPDLMVAASFVGDNTLTVWGALDCGPTRFRVDIFRGAGDEFLWAVSPRVPPNCGTVLLDVEITEDGIRVYDEVMRRGYVYSLADPDCFKRAVDHVWYDVDIKLGEIGLVMSWIARGQEVDPRFDEYGNNIESRLDVLRSKRASFTERYQALNL